MQHHPQTPSTTANPRHTKGLARLLGGALTTIVLITTAGATQATAAATECPNQAFRTGPSANLPDCRAYELVTPSNADGRPLEFPRGEADLFPTEVASPNGGSFVFQATGGPLAEPAEGNGVIDVYQASRTAGGWRTLRRLSPSGAQLGEAQPQPGGVSADGQFAVVNISKPTLGTEGSLSTPGADSAYVQRPDGSFELVGVGSLGEEREAEARWISPQGDHLIFSTGGGQIPAQEAKQLEPNAAPTGTPAVYDRSALGGPTHVISLLPGDVPLVGEAIYQGASSDGAVVAFRVGVGGPLYVRIDDSSTVLVPTVGGGTQTFAGLTGNGDHLFFVEGGDVFSFDTSAATTERVTNVGNAELVTVSSDGSHVYFISESQINGEGIAGKPDLFVWDAASKATTFIATVSAADLGEQQPRLNSWTTRVVNAEGNPRSHGPGFSSARTTPDGSVIAFESEAKLTSYDNAHHKEIYRYDTRDHSLLCVSCNPSGIPAVFSARFEDPEASRLSSQTIINNLSSDGERVFFETEEALVPGDVDGNNDIYEWRGGAEPTISLISSGRTPLYPAEGGEPSFVNVIGAITPSGSDVFFLTLDALTPTAGADGNRAFYDAREDGGFPEPLDLPCQGEACRPASGIPSLAQTVTSTFTGADNQDLAAPLSRPVVKAKAKSLTRAQHLARALKQCRKGKTSKKRRAACEKSARKKYGRGK